MEALNLTLFASILLAVSAVLFFIWNVGKRAHEHTEHLSLLPLDDDAPAQARASAASRTTAQAEPAKGTR